MPVPQPPWFPTYRCVDLEFVDLDGDSIVRGTKAQLLGTCQEQNIHRRAVTPYETRLGRGYVIQGTGNRRDNTICLLTHDNEFRQFQIRPPFLGYEPYLEIWDLAKLLSRLADDYPEGTPTRALTDALTDVVRMWLAAKQVGRFTIDLRDLDQALAVRLNPHVRAWLHPMAHQLHERPEFDDNTGRYKGSGQLWLA